MRNADQCLCSQGTRLGVYEVSAKIGEGVALGDTEWLMAEPLPWPASIDNTRGSHFMNFAKYGLTAATAFLLAIALTEGGCWIRAATQTTEPSRFPSGIRGLAGRTRSAAQPALASRRQG